MNERAKVPALSVEAEAVAEVVGEDEEVVLVGEEASENRTLSYGIHLPHRRSCHFLCTSRARRASLHKS